MTASATIRRATFDDVQGIHTLTQSAYAEYRTLIPYSSIWQETPQEIASELELGSIFLAEIEAKPVGSVRCYRQTTLEIERCCDRPFCDRPFLYIHRLAVLPSCRRLGLGRLLMQTVEAEAQSQHLSTLCLEVRTAQPENQEFYTHLGYHLGAISRRFSDGSPRAYWMTKEIHPLTPTPPAID
ncbi:MAG: GNAT family N-acetyltransferase [Oculatellaceae cyanobacterium Prado106]|jgi:ribosomal protein S18 acetylase RimI-like enzyme|nr:GNAT family N-acetyltransferase [Oculatellaceae cyanobacterium Prado106]